MTSLRFLTFTFWNSYVLKLLRLETLTFSDVTLSDINDVWCYVLSQYPFFHEHGSSLHARYWTCLPVHCTVSTGMGLCNGACSFSKCTLISACRVLNLACTVLFRYVFVHALLKGTGSRDEYFLRVFKIKTALSVHEQMINEILGWLGKEKFLLVL